MVFAVILMTAGLCASGLAADNGGDMKSNPINAAAGRVVIDFDKDWKFQRTDDAPDMKDPSYNDKKWKKLNVPHDWAIEGTIKPKKSVTAAPVMQVVAGEWRFSKGDDQAWKAAGFNDSGWQKVRLPAKWNDHSGYNDEKSYGWYRRKLSCPFQ
jgi:hypothetical protein